MEMLTEMLNTITSVVVVVAIIVILIFVICLSLLIYLSEDRKKLVQDFDKLKQKHDTLFGKYLECTLHNTVLLTKVELLERFTNNESDDEDDE